MGDPDRVREDVEIGEFLHQLQQGIGRGTLRQGKPQSVHLFHNDQEKFGDELRRAFPMSSYNGVDAANIGRAEYLEDDDEDFEVEGERFRS